MEAVQATPSIQGMILGQDAHINSINDLVIQLAESTQQLNRLLQGAKSKINLKNIVPINANTLEF